MAFFKKILTNHVFAIGEARHFKFPVLIDSLQMSTSACMI